MHNSTVIQLESHKQMELNMKPLNVRFDNTVFDTIESLSENTPHSKSDIARAAMSYGLKHLESLDGSKLSGHLHLSKIMVLFKGDKDVVDEMLEQAFNSRK